MSPSSVLFIPLRHFALAAAAAPIPLRPQTVRVVEYVTEFQFFDGIVGRHNLKRTLLALFSLLELQNFVTDTLWVVDLATKWRPYNSIGTSHASGRASVWSLSYTLSPSGDLAWCVCRPPHPPSADTPRAIELIPACSQGDALLCLHAPPRQVVRMCWRRVKTPGRHLPLHPRRDRTLLRQSSGAWLFTYARSSYLSSALDNANYLKSYGTPICTRLEDFYNVERVYGAIAAGNLTDPDGQPYPNGTTLLDIYPDSTGVFTKLAPFRILNETEEVFRVAAAAGTPAQTSIKLRVQCDVVSLLFVATMGTYALTCAMVRGRWFAPLKQTTARFPPTVRVRISFPFAALSGSSLALFPSRGDPAAPSVNGPLLLRKRPCAAARCSGWGRLSQAQPSLSRATATSPTNSASSSASPCRRCGLIGRSRRLGGAAEASAAEVGRRSSQAPSRLRRRRLEQLLLPAALLVEPIVERAASMLLATTATAPRRSWLPAHHREDRRRTVQARQPPARERAAAGGVFPFPSARSAGRQGTAEAATLRPVGCPRLLRSAAGEMLTRGESQEESLRLPTWRGAPSAPTGGAAQLRRRRAAALLSRRSPPAAAGATAATACRRTRRTAGARAALSAAPSPLTGGAAALSLPPAPSSKGCSPPPGRGGTC